MYKNSTMQSNINWLDNIRFLATIFVVIIHIVFPIVEKFEVISPLYWHTANIIESICRSAVPLFVMLSGALLLGKNEELILFYRKRLQKIAIPFVIWSLVYLVISYLSKFFFNSSDQNKLLWLASQLKNGTAYHLWYIYMILGLYLTIPYLTKLIPKLNKIDFYMFFILWACTLFLKVPIINSYFPNFDLTFFTGYIGYLLLGYFLANNYNLFSCKSAGCMIMAGWICTVILTYFYSRQENKFVGIFYNYLSPNVALISAGLFVFLRDFKINNQVSQKIIQTVSKYSFGIYLNHVLIITILYKFGLDWKIFNPILGIIITFLFVLTISLIFTFATEKMKIRKYLG